MRKFLIIILTAVAGVVVLLFGIVLLHGFPLSLMDLNEDGFVSPSEFLGSLDQGHRPTHRGEIVCTEIFSLKVGMPIKEVCPGD